MLAREIRLFFTALMFFTRIPCPAWVDHSDEYLNHASRYFPLMGWIVGGFAGAVLLGSMLIVPPTVAILLSMIASVLLTGAFHEDGFADACDGFGGGWTRERILEIMQDSRLGTFGVIGLGLVLALKFACLVAMLERTSPITTAFVLLSAHATSRLTAVTFLVTHSYARTSGESKAKPLATRMTTGEFLFAGACGLAPLLLLAPVFSWKILLLLAPLAFVKWYAGRFFVRWIQGYTGDCLGAVQQSAEVALYLTCVILLNVKF